MPAIIVEEPDDTENILTMFHIHNVREGWQLMPTALKLQTLMERLETTSENTLAELTKLSVPQIRRCKILLSYPKRFQNLMLSPPTERMKADFFIELDRIRRPFRADKFDPWVSRGDSQAIQTLLEKYESGAIKAVTEFRSLAETYKASQRIRKERAFAKRFDEFMNDPDSTVPDVQVVGASFALEAKEIGRSAKRLISQIQDLDLGLISSDAETISALKRLKKLLDQKLAAALLVGPRE